MKSGQKNKLLLVLGLFNEFFSSSDKKTKISLLLKTGKNNYKADILPSRQVDGTFIFSGPGKTVEVKSLYVINMIADEVILYDEAEIYFYNNTISKKIVANDKNVSISDVVSKDSGKTGKTSTDNDLHLNDANYFSGVSSKREYFIKINEAGKLLKTIGIIDENGKILNDKIRKYNQIDRFIEFADQVLQESITKKEKVTILDLACGKSYLSFVLYYYLTEKLGVDCEIIGLDRMEGVINSSDKMAKELGYKNMKFLLADLEKYEHRGDRPTICISLHACDTATDYALFTAVKAKSKGILCLPCCHRELLSKKFNIPELSGTVFKHNAIKEKFSALFTESIRILLLESCGYKASITEYISPLDTPKNLLIKAIYQGNRNESAKALVEYNKLKNMYGCDITFGNLLEREGLIK